MGYSSISSSRIALWVTNDMGFFKKQGLAAEVIVTPGIQGTQALMAGELQFYLGGVDSAALAASRGSDLVALATAEPIEYKLIAQPTVKTVKDLKGKKVVVDRVGGTSYYVSLQILEKVGLKPGDVELVQVGGGGNQRVAAFKSGLVSGVVTATDRFEQLKIPYHVLADAHGNGNQSNGELVSYDPKFSRSKQGRGAANHEGAGTRATLGQGPKKPRAGPQNLQSLSPQLGPFLYGSSVPKKCRADPALSLYEY